MHKKLLRLPKSVKVLLLDPLQMQVAMNEIFKYDSVLINLLMHPSFSLLKAQKYTIPTVNCILNFKSLPQIMETIYFSDFPIPIYNKVATYKKVNPILSR